MELNSSCIFGRGFCVCVCVCVGGGEHLCEIILNLNQFLTTLLFSRVEPFVKL